jgi:hypothetical protein
MSFARPMTVVLALCLCLASIARGAQPVELHVSFRPDLAGRRTTIDLALQINGAGALSSPLRSFALRLPPSMGLGGTTLGQANCEPKRLVVSGLAGCSGNARIGFGSARVVVPIGKQRIQEQASLNVLLGAAATDRLEVLWLVQATEPVLARLVLPSVFEEAPLPYGEELAAAVPLVEVWPEGPDLLLQTLSVSIGPNGLVYHRQVNGKVLAYRPSGMRVPRACPAGGYPFEALLGFQDGTRLTGVYRVPCPRR